MSCPRRRSFVVMVILSLLTIPVFHGQETGLAFQRSDGRPLSLDDLAELDALLAEDTASMAPVLDQQTIVDLAALSLVVALGTYSFFRKSDRLKVVTLMISVGYLGFAKASLVSIVDIFGALQLSLPTVSTAVPYYVLIGLTIASTVLWGRFYCGRVCAFGALTQLMDRVIPSRFRLEPPVWLDRRAIYIKYVVLFAATAYVMSGGNTLVYRYIEPFWMFTLSGNAVMWTLLGLLLLATVFVRNLYCRYLCAVGAGLGLLSSLTIFPIRRWNECRTCTICEKACEWGAIRGPTIIKSECVRCDDCERLYADETTCPHWLILARGKRRIPVVTVD